jgi:predicted CoA-substrate-specific enzyme activase
MLSVGVDIGSLWTKAVVLRDGAVAASEIRPTGVSGDEAGREALRLALEAAGAAANGSVAVAVTGAGKGKASFATERVNEVVSAARGARLARPDALGVLDLGAESTRAVRLDESGEVAEYSLNDKCASGTGIFLDAMARAMGVAVEDMGPLSLTSTAEVAINTTCVVFAESEVVSQVHRRTPKQDILRGMHRAIATRVFSQASRVGLVELARAGRVIVLGGLARNAGIVACLEELLGARLNVPENDLAQLASAAGAALVAADGAGAREGGRP